MRQHRPSRVQDRSAFAGFRFPPEVITVAVRWMTLPALQPGLQCGPRLVRLRRRLHRPVPGADAERAGRAESVRDVERGAVRKPDPHSAVGGGAGGGAAFAGVGRLDGQSRLLGRVDRGRPLLRLWRESKKVPRSAGMGTRAPAPVSPVSWGEPDNVQRLRPVFCMWTKVPVWPVAHSPSTPASRRSAPRQTAALGRRDTVGGGGLYGATG